MNKTHEFYPMISGTLKSLLTLPPKKDLWEYIRVISDYPDYSFIGNSIIDGTNAVMAAIITELDRQYSRWNKGGNK